MTTATYAVVGMSCQHCVDAVTADHALALWRAR